MPAPVTVKKSGPGLAQLKADIARISKSEVLVGIPADKRRAKRGLSRMPRCSSSTQREAR